MSPSTDASSRELRWLVTAAVRGPSRLEHASAAPTDPSFEALTALLDTVAPARLWIGGGEPTLRADLPELIEAARARDHVVGLETDGLALVGASAVARLKAAGLSRVRVSLHAGRADAHDWLVRTPGAARRVVRAIKTLRDAALEVEIAAVLTRPTVDHVGELIALARDLGVADVQLTRLDGSRLDAGAHVALMPRLAFVQSALVRAHEAARDAGVRLALSDFPLCAMPRSTDPKAAVEPLAVAEWQSWLVQHRAPARVEGCPSCPRDARCAGAPADYVACFGRTELDAPGGFVACVEPLEGVAALRMSFPAGESTRSIRRRLVRAARTGVRHLRIASTDSMAHPAAAQLLREATLLSFERVEVTGDASALDEFSDADLYLVKGVARVDAALRGPDAERHDRHTGVPGSFDATLRGLERVARIAEAEVGCYAVLDAGPSVGADLVDYQEAWRRGRLPGAPQIRLSPAGGALGALAAQAHGLEDEPMKRALAQVLPACVWEREGELGSAPLGTCFVERAQWAEPPDPGDLRGIFRACVCSQPLQRLCPGLALGWTLETNDVGEEQT